MNKDIYSMLNDTRIDTSDYNREDFDDLRKKQLKKYLKKNIGRKQGAKKKIICAAACAALLICLVQNNTGASAVERIGDMIGENIATLLGIEKNIDNYKTVLNKSVTDKGITVTLKEVILDKDELTVLYDVKSDKKLSEDDSWDGFNALYINGKEVNGCSGGQSSNINEYTTESVITYDLGECNLNGDITIKLESKSITRIYDEKGTKGNWTFEFKTNGDQLKIDTKKIAINNTFTLENGTKYTLKEYSHNALGQKIYASISHNNKNSAYNVILKGYDDLGNKIQFYVSHSDKNNALFKIDNFDDNLDEKATILKLTPYAAKYPEKSGKMDGEYKKAGDEFTIDLTKLK